MPKRTDIHTILILGSGPIVIGQGCEFDYSGVQACKALRREGYRVVLVNSNPATIMTDPEMADATYVEPLTVPLCEKIIAAERPDALLPTVGGQTGLNLAMDLAHAGVLEKYGVRLIGAQTAAIELAEDRLKFKDAMIAAGLAVPASGLARSVAEAETVASQLGFPCLVRPSFTLGGSGGGIAYSVEDLRRIAAQGIAESPVGEVLVEQSVLGWKEYELEVMRDRADNFVVVCSIENIDPMGVHTGDSITVAPAQTLTDREYQRLRDMARTVIQTVGVETGGSNVQFAVNPRTGEVVVIEMNPRVSRSSALASKATGFPIAKIAALLAVGYTLDEILNDITRVTPASFEPSIDYCVVKIPRWNFEKFPGADRTLGPQMKSVGEVMAIGRTFPEALNKAIRGLEIGASGFGTQLKVAPDAASPALSVPTAQRLFAVADALRTGAGVDHVVAETEFDPWFVSQMAEMLAIERELANHVLATLPFDLLRRAKRHGFSDAQIARALGLPAAEGAQAVRAHRLAQGLKANYYRVDTCAAEFEAFTPYLYSTYEQGDEAEPTENRKVIILGGGPNRIGQGIEFDYCCVHACFALKELGYETIMVNCNPETVSTDYDTADRLYFEPLTLEDVLNIVDEEQPDGVIVQFGGQTPLNLARGLAEAGVPIWGTSPDAIDLAEDRVRFGELLRKLDIPSPDWGTAQSLDAARRVAARIGYPVLVRPSYVLGGRAMEIAYDDASLADYLAHAQAASPDGPVLIDHYLEDAFELDVDAIADGERVVIAGVMQHIEEAGVHSGDSACVLPPYKISLYHQTIVYEYVERLGLALGVKGLMNVQLAIKDDIVYVLEVNPRASRTVPYVSKATGVPIAKLAAKVMAGAEAGRSRLHGDAAHRRLLRQRGGAAVPEIPRQRLPAGTGDALDRRGDGARAELRACLRQGSDRRRVAAADIGRGADHRQRLRQGRGRQDRTRSAPAGLPTLRHARHRRLAGRVGLPVTTVKKVSEGQPNIRDMVEAGELQLIINTPLGARAHDDGRTMRTAAVLQGVPIMTTLSAASAAVNGIVALRAKELDVTSLQAHYARTRQGPTK